PAIANQVLSFHLLTFDKDYNLIEYQIEKESEPLHDPEAFKEYYGDKIKLIQNDDIFNSVITSCGTCGVVYSYYLKLQDAYNVVSYAFLTNYNAFRTCNEWLMNQVKDGVIDGYKVAMSP